MEQRDYERLIEAGLHGVYIYQETYGPRYSEYHPKGRKKDMEFRLLTPDRLGKLDGHRMKRVAAAIKQKRLPAKGSPVGIHWVLRTKASGNRLMVLKELQKN